MFDLQGTLAHSSPFAQTHVAGNLWQLSRRTEMVLLALVGVAQVAILVGMIVLDGLPIVLGERVKLNVIPVDPRDLFRGDYVVLGYDFSNAPLSAITGPQSSRDWDHWGTVGSEVYVSLQPQGDRHMLKSVSLHRPTSGTYLRGKRGWRNRVECGIEAYYVQEGEGRRLETAIRARKLTAEVAIWNGKAKLVRLIE